MIDEQLKQLKDIYNSYFKFMSSRLIGMEHQIKKAFITFMANGHLLIEGPPGLGKTTFVKHFSNFFDLSFSRIQFTPDLMPLDIIGSNIIQEEENGKKRFVFYKGPIFANIVLADEINRATPKTQSACLEAMEEKKITFLGKTYDLPKPFMLIATQNSIDLEGTYPLPEAQVDRFFMKIYTDYPEFKILKQIVEKNEIWQVEGSGAGWRRHQHAIAHQFLDAHHTVERYPDMRRLLGLAQEGNFVESQRLDRGA